jgi:hypothetical protein
MNSITCTLKNFYNDPYFYVFYDTLLNTPVSELSKENFHISLNYNKFNIVRHSLDIFICTKDLTFHEIPDNNSACWVSYENLIKFVSHEMGILK